MSEKKGETSSMSAGMKGITKDMMKSEPLSLTGGRPNPIVVANQDHVPELGSGQEPKTSQDKVIGSITKSRYSDDELAEFKVIILEKLETAEKLFKFYDDSVRGVDKNDASDTSPSMVRVGEAENDDEKEKNEKLAFNQKKIIGHLMAALVRIENKTYGICRETGKLIGKERLRAVPHATLSIDAKNNQK